MLASHCHRLCATILRRKEFIRLSTLSVRDGGVDPVAYETQNLVDRIRKGDSSAQEEFVNLYRRPIQAIATARTGDPEAARDICQDVLIAVLAAIERDKIREPDKLSAFVQGTARNLINNFLCTQKHRRETDIDLVDIPSEDPMD